MGFFSKTKTINTGRTTGWERHVGFSFLGQKFTFGSYKRVEDLSKPKPRYKAPKAAKPRPQRRRK